MNRTAGRLSVICAVTLALYSCGGDKASSPTASSPTAAVQAARANGGEGSVSAQAAEPKVTICHVPPGNPDNAHTITIGAPAVPAHLANHDGDAVGPCPEPTPTPSPTPTPGA
jgi:hypothetical protein